MGPQIEVAGHAVPIVGAAVLGVVVGLMAGLFGVGGGFLLTPLLHLVFGVPLPIAVGTGLSLMVGTTLPALLRNRQLGRGELRVDLLMLGGSALGVGAGARTLDALDTLGTVTLFGRPRPAAGLVVQVGFVVLLLTVAAVFWGQGKGARMDALTHVRRGPLSRIALPPRVDLPRIPIAGISALLLAYMGLGLGFLSGLLGIGGGVVLMPALVYGFGFPLRQASGTGVLVLVVTASVGTVAHALRGNVHVGLTMALLVGASLAAQVGAIAGHRLPVPVLRRSFALVLMATVIAIAWRIWRPG